MDKQYMETNVLTSEHVVLADCPIRVAFHAANGEFTSWLPIAAAEALLEQLSVGIQKARADASERAMLAEFRARNAAYVAPRLVESLAAAAAE